MSLKILYRFGAYLQDIAEWLYSSVNTLKHYKLNLKGLRNILIQ